MTMVIVRGVTGRRVLLAARFGADGAGIGHDQDIAKVGDAGAIEMVLGKAFYNAVGVMIPRTPVPAFVDIGGTDLYGAEGDACAEENVAVSAGADVRIDI